MYRYWAHVALGRLQRLLAVQEWEKVSLYSDAPDSFETSLAAFDMFILHERRLGDMNDVRPNVLLSGIAPADMSRSAINSIPILNPSEQIIQK